MQLTSLTDEELLRHAEVDFDPLTGTALEAELLRRFREGLTVADDTGPRVVVVDEFGIGDPADLRNRLEVFSDTWTPDVLKKALEVLEEFDVAEPDTLRAQLTKAQAADEATDQLAALLETLQPKKETA